MTTQTTALDSERLRAVAVWNGRSKVSLLLYDQADLATPIATDELNLASAAEREAVIARLPQALRPEADEDLQQLAARVAPERISSLKRGTAARKERAASPDRLDQHLVEAGNSERFAILHGERVRYVAKWGQWLVWKGGCWRIDHNNVLVMELAKGVGRRFLAQAAKQSDTATRNQLISWAKVSLSARGIRGMLELARGVGGIPIEHDALDADPWLLCVKNGTVNLRTGEFRAPQPADLMTMQAPVAYDSAATAPRWDRALNEWFPDVATREYVQRLIGSALVGEQRDHIFLIHYGGGRNGKGTLVKAIKRTLGPYFVAINLSLIVQQKHAEHATVKASLFRARLAVASETEKRVSLAEASVKTITGGDTIRCRRMHEDEWQFEPSHSLWLLTNHLPRISGRDRGIWSRIRVIPWIANFEDAPQKDLDDVLASELPGILAWAVRGCLAWQREGLVEPEAVKRATLEYRSAEDVFSRFAADTSLVFDRTQSISVATINQMFDGWAESEGVRLDRREFTGWLKQEGAVQSRGYDELGKRYRAWTGVGLGTNGTSVPGSSSYAPLSKKNAAQLSRLSHDGPDDHGEAWEPDESQLEVL